MAYLGHSYVDAMKVSVRVSVTIPHEHRPNQAVEKQSQS